MPDYDRLVACMAPSKTFNLAGLMISNVMIWDKELRAHWLDRHYNFDNPLSIAAAQAAYEKGGPWLEELRVYLDENFAFTREYLAEHLPTFFAYEAGVLLKGGNMFVQNSDCFIRLYLVCPKVTLAEGLRRICQAVNTKHTEKYTKVV